MDEDTKRSVLERLSKLGVGEQLKMVLTLKQNLGGTQAPPSPDAFLSRLEYRKALIAQQADETVDHVRSTVSKLRNLGLATQTAQLSGSVIVEGTVEQLVKALGEENVENAFFDEKITLIEPVGDESIDPDK